MTKQKKPKKVGEKKRKLRVKKKLNNKTRIKPGTDPLWDPVTDTYMNEKGD